MTFDDLIEEFRTQPTTHAGIRAVVRALRDEIVPPRMRLKHSHMVSYGDLLDGINKILISDGEATPAPAADEYTLCRACGHLHIATTKPPEELP